MIYFSTTSKSNPNWHFLKEWKSGSYLLLYKKSFISHLYNFRHFIFQIKGICGKLLNINLLIDTPVSIILIFYKYRMDVCKTYSQEGNSCKKVLPYISIKKFIEEDFKEMKNMYNVWYILYMIYEVTIIIIA